MTTINENSWNDDQNQAGTNNSSGTANNDGDSNIDSDSLSGDNATGNIPGSYSSNESFSGPNSPDDDDDFATGDDIETDEDLIDTDDDFDEEDDLDTDDDSAVATGSYSIDDADADGDLPAEMSEQDGSDNEITGYDNQTEVERQQGGGEASWSEQTDVTPPRDHGFPDAAGSPKTDFASRPHGRTTGRMVGHEPGTESI